MSELLFPIHIQNTKRTTASQRRHRFLRLSSLFLSCTLLLLRPNSNFAMRLVVQRVKSASVTVDGKVVSSIGLGAMALVGIHEHDTEKDLQYCAKRLLACKLWENDAGATWRHGVKQRGIEVLCVSQFTLYGKLSKKNQPDYKHAMKSIAAQEMYSQFLRMLRSDYEPEKILDGVFGAMMDVALVNDGPVTIVIESDVQEPEKEPAENSEES